MTTENTALIAREQHVQEDLGFIPSFADWVRTIRSEPWTGRARRLEHEVDPASAASRAEAA